MLFSAKISLATLPVLFILLISACSDSEESPSPTPFVETVDFSATSAFNTFDETTFSDSTCTNIPMTTPVGIFVAVNGRSEAKGTQDDPLDLQTALTSSTSHLQPGETLWLLSGRYSGTFDCDLRGEEGAHISIRPMPGKRVLIDSKGGNGSAALTMSGSAQWCDVYGLEFTSSDKNRGSVTEESPNVSAKTGLTILGPHINAYNTVVYDNVGSGIDFWKTAIDSTLHGNIIYNNGHSAKGRGHGHGIYTQNTYGYKNITKNIIFFGYQTGLHPYSTSTAPLNNFSIENNVWFLAGASDPRDNQQKTNLIVFTKAGIDNMRIANNKGYTQVNRGSSIFSHTETGTASFTDNYLVERLEVYGLWEPIDFINNTIYGNINDDDNSINTISGNVFEVSRPSSGLKIFIDSNTVDPRRGRIVVYNYANEDNVTVDLSSTLKEGEAYRIHSVFGLFDAPLLEGVYSGNEIILPMGTVSPPQPNGDLNGIDEDDGPKKKFGVFIVTHGGCI